MPQMKNRRTREGKGLARNGSSQYTSVDPKCSGLSSERKKPD